MLFQKKKKKLTHAILIFFEDHSNFKVCKTAAAVDKTLRPMENGDDWLAADKLYHVIFCFSISIVSSLLAARTRYPFLRRRSIWIGSLLSLAAGAAKEFADELGYFKSAGASSKDAAADLLGILLAAMMLSLSNCRASSSRAGPDRLGQSRELDMVWIGADDVVCLLLLVDVGDCWLGEFFHSLAELLKQKKEKEISNYGFLSSILLNRKVDNLLPVFFVIKL